MSRSGLNQAYRMELNLNEIAHNFTTTRLRYVCIDRPGEYNILKLTAVTSEFVLRLGFNLESIENDIILKLVEGDVVNVVEVKVDHQSNRIRARITDPVPGWISLRKNLNGSRWAFRTERHQLQDRMAVGEFYAWKEYKLKDANSDTKKHELESRLRIVAKLHFNEMTHLSVTDIGNEQVVIAVTYIDKIVADFEAACISVAREGAARHASCYDLPYYGIFHNDILEAVRRILGESYPEVCVETKSWGANIGNRSTCRGHRLVFTMNLRFNGFCTLRCDACDNCWSCIPLRDKPSSDASLLNADLDMHNGNSIDASWSWRHPTWLRVHDQSIQNRESRGWVYGNVRDSCSIDSWRFTRDYCTDSSSDANFSIVVSNNFGNAMKEKVEYAKIRMIELLDNMPAHEYFVAHIFDGLCPDELTLVEIEQQMQTMIGLHAEFNGINVNIDREDLNYFERCLDERIYYDECIREPPEQNISFKRLSLWMSAFFHEKIVEQFVEECETKKILGLTTYSRTYDVPFGDHYIGGGFGSNQPIPNEDFTFPDYEKRRKMDEGKFKGLALSQRRAEDAVKGLRKLFDKLGLKAVDVETKRSLCREVKKQKHGFRESHYAKWQLEVKAKLPLSGRDEPPNELLCPITCDVMIDPVVAADGHTYEREAIEEWFSHFQQGQSPRSPKTNETIETRLLFPNHAIRSQCSGHTK